MENHRELQELASLLGRIPPVTGSIASGCTEDGAWWVKFSLDISHSLAWNAVQELGHVLNYLSVEERLPTVFMPVSPPPYLNGGPSEFLSWVIECHDPECGPCEVAKWLEGRLPSPIEEIEKWASSCGI